MRHAAKQLSLVVLAAALYVAGCSLEHADMPAQANTAETVRLQMTVTPTPTPAQKIAEHFRRQSRQAYLYAHMIPERGEHFRARAAAFDEAASALDKLSSD